MFIDARSLPNRMRIDADVCVIGAGAAGEPTGPYRSQAIGQSQFGFCVAAHHPLAGLPQPLSRADITRAAELLGYRPVVGMDQGLKDTLEWYREKVSG